MAEARIVRDPKILCGKPVIAGTRISVELVLEKLGNGDTVADLLSDYPHLTEQDIRAAMLYASQALRFDVIHPLPSIKV